MLKPPLIPVLAVVALSGCVAQQGTIPSRVQTGDLAPTSNLSVIGVLDTTGVNVYSLFEGENERQGD
ncbi:MAG: hypothetical protein R3C52_10115 [Hyphomonadaceae bacterium]